MSHVNGWISQVVTWKVNAASFLDRLREEGDEKESNIQNREGKHQEQPRN